MRAHRLIAISAVLAAVAQPLFAQRYKPLGGDAMPDTLELADGTRLNGMIVRNSADSVLFQTADSVREIP
ncbi:MAG: hypothetical protein ACKOEG_02030 [Chthoniobacterales bacterium]